MKKAFLFLSGMLILFIGSQNHVHSQINRIWLTHRTNEPSHLIINWVSDRPGNSKVSFYVDKSKEYRFFSNEKTTLHHAEIPLGEKDVIYHYKVGTGKEESGYHSFKAYPSGQEELRVAVVGNWGYSENPDLSRLIKDDPHLLLTLGDNIPNLHDICGEGVTDCIEPFLKLIDSAPGLFQTTPIMPVLGNHDKEIKDRGVKYPPLPVYDINAAAYCKFFELPDDEWKWHFNIPDFNICFIALDLCHISDFGTTWQACHNFHAGSEQMKWYREVIEKSMGKRIITLTNEKNSTMRKLGEGEWKNLFQRGTTVISGFGYYMERADVKGFPYFNASLKAGDKYPDEFSKILKDISGYILMSFTKESSLIEMKSLDGEFIDRYSFYPLKTLSDAFSSIGFDPAKKGNSFFMVTADVHYGFKGTDGMLTTIHEVNDMDSHPAFLCVDGDMILSASPSFGIVPTPGLRQKAIDEFRAFKKDIDLLNPEVRFIPVLGNHDTHPQEIDPEIFREVFPGYPAYQSFDLSGMHLIVLNGHSTGYIDPKQTEWLTKDVNSIPKDQNVIIFVHQPSMSRRVRERGIPKALTAAFKDHQGMIWLIGGHEHVNDQKVFQFPKTKLVEHLITCGTANMWGGPERPGYWIYCLSNGEVAGRIFKHRTQGYRIEAKPDLTGAENVPMPFDHLENIVWKTMVGTDDRNYLINANAGDCLNYWANIRELTYRLPLKKAGNFCTKIAMLCDYPKIKTLYQEGQYFLSSDLTKWQEIKIEDAQSDVLIFLIPEYFKQSENIYIKFIPAGEAYVGGFALTH